jgi:hypothetical protein
MLRVFMYDTFPRPMLVSAQSPKRALAAIGAVAGGSASQSVLRAVSDAAAGAAEALARPEVVLHKTSSGVWQKVPDRVSKPNPKANPKAKAPAKRGKK